METILGRDGSDVLGEVTNLGEMATNVDKLLAYVFILYEVWNVELYFIALTQPRKRSKRPLLPLPIRCIGRGI
jgi:hypothetical protein